MRGSTQKKEEEMGRRVWLRISDVLGTQFGTFFQRICPSNFWWQDNTYQLRVLEQVETAVSTLQFDKVTIASSMTDLDTWQWRLVVFSGRLKQKELPFCALQLESSVS